MTSRFLRSVFCVVPEFTDYQTGSRCLLPLPCVLHFNVEFSSGKFDYVLTVSTPAMQAVANSNKQGKTIQIFGLVTDPFISGVGLDKDHPELHPRHLLGYGSFLPVTEVIKIAKQLYPPLKSIGLAWNAAESILEDYTLLAREYTKEIGIELLGAKAVPE